MIYLIVVLFLSIFTASNIFIGLKGWNIVRHYIPAFNIYLYWAVIILIAFSFIIGRVGRKFLPGFLEETLNFIGSYWLAMLFYFFFISVIAIILRMLINATGIGGSYRSAFDIKLILDVSVFLIVFLILIFGTYNANNSKVVNYNLTINKKAADLKKLNIVTIADIHFGGLVGKARMEKMVREINSLNPDIVFLCGDIIDDDINPFIDENMKDTFKKINSKYGVYGVLGNHEYFGKDIEKIELAYKEADIKLLKDNMEKVENSFYIVGRDDASAKRFNNKNRMEISELLKSCDKSLPIIVLDHQPVDIEGTEMAGADLQFSGHTHKGQFFPVELVTSRMFKIDYGYLKENNFNIIVTSGFGTWGPPIRVGTKSEIVKTEILFKQ